MSSNSKSTSVSLRSRFWRAMLRNTLKKQRLTIAENRASGSKNTRLLGGPPAGVRVEPFQIDGLDAEWLSPPQAAPGQVIVHFHGGGYVTGSIETHRMMCGLLAECAGVKVLLPGYRLAPEHPFPAALEDALKIYHWLLAGGYRPADIILSGDSAGSGLAVATILALRERQEALPAAVICQSPWFDLTLKGQTHLTKARSEAILNAETLREWALAYTGADNLANPLVSPVYADFTGFPPLFIQVGSEEILLDDALQVAEKARAAGTRVECKVWQGMWHDWHVMGKLIPENRQTYAEIGQFARERFQQELSAVKA